MRTHNTNVKDLQLTHLYSIRRDPFPMKPYGLWYAINDEWLEWCHSEMPDRIGRYYHKLEVNESQILIIKTTNEITQFIEEYKYYPFDPILWLINWTEVAKDYKG